MILHSWRSLGWTLLTLLSHWRRHPVQLSTWLVGLMLATALWSGVQALNDQARDSYDRAAAVFEGADRASLVPQAGRTVPHTMYRELRQAGWPVSPVVEGRLRIQGRDWVVLGIDPVTLPAQAAAANAVSSGQSDARRFITQPGLTLVAPDTQSDLGVTANEPWSTGAGQGLPPLQSAEGIPPGTLLMDIGHAQRLLNQPDAVSRLLITDPAWAYGQALPGAGSGLLRWHTGQAEDDLVRLTDSFHLNLTALGALAFLVG
ncbi:MAG: ABC transporter permease, partial [Natronospirillum sp.]